MEENLRRAMLIARGDPSTFVTRPISGSLLAVAGLLLIVAVAADDRAQARRGVRRRMINHARTRPNGRAVGLCPGGRCFRRIFLCPKRYNGYRYGVAESLRAPRHRHIG